LVNIKFGVNVIVYNPKILLYITRDTYIYVSHKYKIKIIKLLFIILKIKVLKLKY